MVRSAFFFHNFEVEIHVSDKVFTVGRHRIDWAWIVHFSWVLLLLLFIRKISRNLVRGKVLGLSGNLAYVNTLGRTVQSNLSPQVLLCLLVRLIVLLSLHQIITCRCLWLWNRKMIIWRKRYILPRRLTSIRIGW